MRKYEDVDGRLVAVSTEIVSKLRTRLPRTDSTLDWDALQREIFSTIRDHLACGDCFDGWRPDDRGIQRCDTCARFPDDDTAAVYVAHVLRVFALTYGEDPFERAIVWATRQPKPEAMNEDS
jgi:hypothetical protein